MNNLNYIRQRYEMPFIRCGMRVEHLDQPGRIVGGHSSGNLRIRLDNVTENEKRVIVACHPRSETTYYDRKGKVLASYTEQGETQEEA